MAATEPILYEQLTDKYRPKTLKDVFGQQNIKQILSGMFDSGRIAKSFLLTGPHSTGKTTISRIIARHLNCVKGPKIACGECPSCKAMDTRTHPDVIEMDAASNRGIDQVRELISRASLSPMVGKKKIFIVDECHSLTPQASEAFLKTLEEPSKSTVFIFCTTDPGKLKATIRSRMRWFKLQALKKDECSALIQMASANEGTPLTPEQSGLIAQYAYGHPREALHLLENVIDFFASEGEVSDVNAVIENVVKKALQMSPEVMAENYVESLLQGLADYTYRILEEVDNPPYFLERVCYILRQNLMVATGSLRMADDYYTRWFMTKQWQRSFKTEDLLLLYKNHIDAMNTASMYSMNPTELLMRTAIESLIHTQALPVPNATT